MRGRDVVIEDLHSTNGTFLDGQRVEMPVLLRPGSVVAIGDTTLELVEPAGQSRSPASTPGGHRETVVTGAEGVVRAAATGVPAGARETSIDAVARSVRETGNLLGAHDYEEIGRAHV